MDVLVDRHRGSCKIVPQRIGCWDHATWLDFMLMLINRKGTDQAEFVDLTNLYIRLDVKGYQKICLRDDV